jgi:glycine betaine/proline transport system ATP-binding protein
MRKAESVVLGKDGLRVALKLMRDKGVPALLVVDRDRKLYGMLTAEHTKQALRDGKEMRDTIIQDIVRVRKDTPLQEILQLMARSDSSYPAAVVDEEGRLAGAVGRGAIFAALAGQAGDAE